MRDSEPSGSLHDLHDTVNAILRDMQRHTSPTQQRRRDRKPVTVPTPELTHKQASSHTPCTHRTYPVTSQQLKRRGFRVEVDATTHILQRRRDVFCSQPDGATHTRTCTQADHSRNEHQCPPQLLTTETYFLFRVSVVPTPSSVTRVATSSCSMRSHNKQQHAPPRC